MDTDKYIQDMREMYRRLDGEMAATLKTYLEIKETYSKLDSALKAIKQEYPKYVPKKVKPQYDKLTFDIVYYQDEIELFQHLLLLGVPLDDFNRVYEQAKSEVLDIFIRYETDPVLNTLMAEHVLSAYIRYCRATRELTYNVAPVYIDGQELPSKQMTNDYLEISLIDYPRITPTLSELHSKWKKEEPVEVNYSMIRVPSALLRFMSFYLSREGDLPMPVFILPEELPKDLYGFIFGDDNLS